MMNTQKELNTLKTCLFICLAGLFSLTAQGQALNLLVSEGSGVLLGDLSPAKVGQQVVLERLVEDESQVWRYDLEAQQWHDLDIKNPVAIMPMDEQAVILHESNNLISLSVYAADSAQITTLFTTADDYLLGENGVYLFNDGNGVARYDGETLHAVSESDFELSMVRREAGVCDWPNGDYVAVGDVVRPAFPGPNSSIPVRVITGGQNTPILFSGYVSHYSNSQSLVLRKRGEFCIIYGTTNVSLPWVRPESYENSRQWFNIIGIVSPAQTEAIESDSFLALGYEITPFGEAYDPDGTGIYDVISIGDFFYDATENKIYKISTVTWERVAEAEIPLPEGPGHSLPGVYSEPWTLLNNVNQKAVLQQSGDAIVLNNGYFTATYDFDLNPLVDPQWSPIGKTITEERGLVKFDDEQSAFVITEAKGVDTRLSAQYPILEPFLRTAGIGVWSQGHLKLFYGDNRMTFGPNERFRQQGQGRLVQATDRYTGRKGIYQLSNTPAIGQFISGAWYDPELANQGLAIHQGKRTDGSEYLFLTAYLFKGGAPLWLAGVGEIPAYNAESITFDLYEFDGLNFLQPNQTANQTTFGSIELRLSDCNTLDIELDDGNNTHALNMYRANDTTYRELCQ